MGVLMNRSTNTRKGSSFSRNRNFLKKIPILVTITREELCRIAAICWGIWQARNELIHVDDPRCYAEIVSVALDYLNSYLDVWNAVNKKAPFAAQRKADDTSWTPPSNGLVKVNCDAGFIGHGSVGLGADIQNEDCDVLIAASARQRASWSAEIAEAKAIHYAMKLASGGGYIRVEVESDSMQVIKMINERAVHLSPVFVIIKDIINLASLFEVISFHYVKRDCNVVAHVLAKNGPLKLGESVWLDDAPDFISDVVAMDACVCFD